MASSCDGVLFWLQVNIFLGQYIFSTFPAWTMNNWKDNKNVNPLIFMSQPKFTSQARKWVFATEKIFSEVPL